MTEADHISPAPRRHISPNRSPTIWGLGPIQLHDRFWASRGVQVVRQGEQAALSEAAEMFLLTAPRILTIFRLREVVDLLNWIRPRIMFLRLHNSRDGGYREEAVVDQKGRFIRFMRSYGGSDARLARVALTRDARLARLWQTAPDTRTGWRRLRSEVAKLHLEVKTIEGRAYGTMFDEERAEFVRDLIRIWQNPATTIPNLVRLAPSVWSMSGGGVARNVRFIGPVWIGAGRDVPASGSVLGPAALWDGAGQRPRADRLHWGQIEPAPSLLRPPEARPVSSLYHRSKRVFDVLFSLLVLLPTLPLYPLVMFLIYLDDGRPFFFAHRRETVGGRTFSCLKFRSMRRNADEIKPDLAARNKADGPQFHLNDDPRLTRVGRFIRKCNIDELPQFINVLLGDMSVVGPRPSPYEENQCCPPWREARLSVRPGLTGLWQVMRTRQPGLDFQEWIKYDLEYVNNAGWRLDLAIIRRTFSVLYGGVLS